MIQRRRIMRTAGSRSTRALSSAGPAQREELPPSRGGTLPQEDSDHPDVAVGGDRLHAVWTAAGSRGGIHGGGGCARRKASADHCALLDHRAIAPRPPPADRAGAGSDGGGLRGVVWGQVSERRPRISRASSRSRTLPRHVLGVHHLPGGTRGLRQDARRSGSGSTIGRPIWVEAWTETPPQLGDSSE